jgi:hypothetical protein
MTKTDQLVNALRERFATDAYPVTSHTTESLAMGYLTGMLGVLEGSDDKLAAALDYHLQDTLKYNATYKI